MSDQQMAPRARVVTADIELDCRGLLCPLPVYMAGQALGRLGSGQTLRVTCTDPGSLADIPAFARQRNLTLLSVSEIAGAFQFDLKRD